MEILWRFYGDFVEILWKLPLVPKLNLGTPLLPKLRLGTLERLPKVLSHHSPPRATAGQGKGAIRKLMLRHLIAARNPI